jgi:hypothetical protein
MDHRSATAVDTIAKRLQSTILYQQPVSSISSGTDMTIYPNFLEGTWQVTQTLVSVDTPLGVMYAGGPNGIVSIAEQSMRESRSRIGQPTSLQLRYIRLLPQEKGGSMGADDGVVVEDRRFNTQQRFDSFAGMKVVANVNYADTRASNHAAMIKNVQIPNNDAQNDVDSVPLTTTTVLFKGPAAQKTFVTAHHAADVVRQYVAQSCTTTNATPSSMSIPWTGFECQRSLFALRNANTAPPITTDTELIFQYQLDDCNSHAPKITHDPPRKHVTGRLRIVGYLNPNDKLYFEAKNRAVTIQDYALDMYRIE